MRAPSPRWARQAYNHEVEQAKEQAAPVLVFCRGERMIPILIIGAQPPPGPGLSDGVRIVLPQLVAAQGRPDWLMLSSETWLQVLPVGAEIPERGQMEAQVRSGDRTGITDAVAIYCVTREGDWMSTQPFVRTPFGVTWDEPTEITDDITGGDLVGDTWDVLRAAVRS